MHTYKIHTIMSTALNWGMSIISDPAPAEMKVLKSRQY